MDAIRVYVADDSPVDRRLIERLLEREPLIQIVGLSSDGTDALAAAVRGDVDALVLDLEMPGLGGVDTLRLLRKAAPGLRVIVFTGSQDAMCSEQAKEAYGSAVQVLPKSEGGAGEIEMIGKRLIPLLTAEPWPARRRPTQRVAPAPVADPKPVVAQAQLPQRRTLDYDMGLLVIGASTGGPNALTAVLSALPEDFPVPVLVTQHMPEGFTAAFADRLDRASKIKVAEAAGGEHLLAGTAWLAPGGRHLEVAREGARLVTKLTDDEPENSCRPAVDPLFRTAAWALGPRVLAVVLTGMGKDGLAGARVIRDEGGVVAVQDEETSVVWGMPGAIAMAGLADFIRPLDDIAPLIIGTVGCGKSRRRGA